MTYTDAAARLFGGAEFSAADFSRRTGNPRAAKVLSELKRRGIVERLDRGRYRLLPPSERPDLRAAEIAEVRRIVRLGPSPMAWSGSTAVEVWTAGRYRISPSPVLCVLDVAIPKDGELAWRKYLERAGVPTKLRKRVGIVVRLTPTGRFERVFIGGEPVIPRRDAEKLISSHPGLYAGARILIHD